VSLQLPVQGQTLQELDTPQLMLEQDAFEANLQQMQEQCLQAGVALRPHAKAHKTPAIARRQLALGAVGICVQKVSEAEPFLEAGIRNILVANQLAGPRKTAHLRDLLGAYPDADIGVCIDHETQLEQLHRSVMGLGNRPRVLVELDVGQGRCGVASLNQAVHLAQRVIDTGLVLGGLQAYHGKAQHLRDPQLRREAIDSVCKQVAEVRQALEQRFMFVPTITGAGTGTYALEAASGLYTEVQPGSYALMDMDYAAIAPEPGMRFRHALTVASTVMSTRPGQRVLDAGLKSMSAESGLPGLHGLSGWEVVGISDEHCVIRAQSREAELDQPLPLGAQVQLIPGHCDPTVNLHNHLVVHQQGRICAVWPIAARGLSQ
jgi:D-threonine aldolase